MLACNLLLVKTDETSVCNNKKMKKREKKKEEKIFRVNKNNNKNRETANAILT